LKATGFYNSGPMELDNTELVTWGTLQALIDTIFPIGVLMMSSNGAPPSSFGGYIVWELYAEADQRYLKLTTNSLLVSTLQS
jgi:hypothetical protein